jgi:hypothetical protein
MIKNKKAQKFEDLKKAKERFRGLSTETIARRLTNFNKTNTIATAYKEILKERGIDDYLSALDELS